MAQKAGGVGILICDGCTYEVATSTCAHCQHITDIPNQRKLTDYVDICRNCNALICLGCVGKPCTPALRRIEAAEETHYRRSQMMKAMGL